MGKKSREFSTEVKELMISLYTESHRVCEITRMLIRPQCTVFDVINNYLKRDSMENKQRSGRPKLVTIHDIDIPQTRKTCQIEPKEMLS